VPRWTTIGSLLLVAAGAAFGQHQQVRQPRTLSRVVDTVVIPGEQLGAIRGVHKERIRVYTCRSGYLIPIVYQLDERDDGGTYCYDQGPRELRVVDSDRGRIDDNDELLVLARDAGARAHPAAFGMVPGYTAVQEVELRDPLDEGKAWVYVFSFRSPPGRLSTDLVDLDYEEIDDEQGRYVWRGPNFTFNNDRSPTNAVRATFGAFNDPETGELSDNVLDCTWINAVVTFMWVTVERRSDDVRVKVGGYIDGPIRIVAQNMLEVYLALGFWVSAPDSYVMLWPNRVSMPTNASCPVDLDEHGESGYTLVWDLRSSATGWSFYNSHNDEPVTIDGEWQIEELRLDKAWPDWNCAFGPEGAIITKFVVPEELQDGSSKLFYRDNARHRFDDDESIEFEPGSYGTNGYYVDMRGLEEGLYPGDYVVWYCPPPFAPGDHVAYLNEYDHPVEARPTGAE